MTLLAEIQSLLERTYAPAGVNLEECLIGRQRSTELARAAGLAPADTPGDACTFLRTLGGNLLIGIYYAPHLVHALEHEDPRRTISHRNIGFFIPFIEEITHGLHAALAFRSGWHRFESEQFACTLELQARVDTYYVLLRFCAMIQGGPPDRAVRRWLLEQLVGAPSTDRPPLRKRYETARLAARRFLLALETLPAAERIPLIRRFRSLSLAGKLRLIRHLKHPKTEPALPSTPLFV